MFWTSAPTRRVTESKCLQGKLKHRVIAKHTVQGNFWWECVICAVMEKTSIWIYFRPVPLLRKLKPEPFSHLQNWKVQISIFCCDTYSTCFLQNTTVNSFLLLLKAPTNVGLARECAQGPDHISYFCSVFLQLTVPQ